MGVTCGEMPRKYLQKQHMAVSLRAASAIAFVVLLGNPGQTGSWSSMG